ncbi:hypothetical protein J6590_020016 [Homalodisca vitripennis]|nr:hypothetical protein J6590_020016 [Homalodisca vitripennis]
MGTVWTDRSAETCAECRAQGDSSPGNPALSLTSRAVTSSSAEFQDFSKWVEIRLLRSATARAVTAQSKDAVLLRYGAPKFQYAVYSTGCTPVMIDLHVYTGLAYSTWVDTLEVRLPHAIRYGLTFDTES